MKEIYKAIPGFSRYEISSSGVVRHIKHKKAVAPFYQKGYRRYKLRSDGGGIKGVMEHRAIYMAHVGDIPEDKRIDHINMIRDDNSIENLRLVTVRENSWNRAVVYNGRGIKLVEDIISMYNSGMTSQEIHRKLKETP